VPPGPVRRRRPPRSRRPRRPQSVAHANHRGVGVPSRGPPEGVGTVGTAPARSQERPPGRFFDRQGGNPVRHGRGMTVVRPRADRVRGSGLPMPRRRTFATDILSFAPSDAACASPSWLRWASYAGSRGTGSPSLSSCPALVRRKPPIVRWGNADRFVTV
jgi:hypothetical protein